MPIRPDQPPTELVFLYGMFRKGASNHSRLKGAKRVAEATIRGRLVKIGWFPALILDPSPTTEVWGDVFQVEAEQLATFLEYEGLAAGAREGEDCRLVQAWVQPMPPSSPPLLVVLWEWTGDTDGAELIATGDWLDVECPKSAPLLTCVAGACALVPVVILVMSLGRMVDGFLGGLLAVVAVLAPVAGWIALRWAGRRRERAELLHFMVMAALIMTSIAAGLLILLGLVSLVAELAVLGF